MEDLAPPLDLINFVRVGLEQGESVKTSIQSYIRLANDSVWRSELIRWTLLMQTQQSTCELLSQLQSPVRKSVLQVLELGYLGSSIYPQLCALEPEIKQTAEIELDIFCAKLPFLALIPLFLLQFPAFLIILLGPLILDIL